MLRHLPILIACTCALCQPATAGKLYKCNEGGRTSYGDQPCRGATTELAVPEAPPPDPEAAARLERGRATLQQIDKERSARERIEEREAARARREALSARRRCDKLRLQGKWAEEDLRRSGGNGGAALEAARIKARRQAEALAVECPA
ncbi:DUF4124 domain-containing protein [Massilia sp. DD77]|uniref:DUF4124 domain-containing protein n=1 Tax=Massilia sp. DD77 TaxID=3109349 RepID=UPI002FFFBFE9